MKVVAFNGSARKQGNTAILIKHLFTEFEKEGIETELIELAGEKIQGCIACYKCFENKDGHCAVKDDIVNECIDKMVEADGIILGSPTYFADISAGMKALIERTGMDKPGERCHVQTQGWRRSDRCTKRRCDPCI
jgi:multimeric flavodoxin WrbA